MNRKKRLMILSDIHKTATFAANHNLRHLPREGAKNSLQEQTCHHITIKMDRKESSSSEGRYKMDYDQCRDDQLNTGVIAALIGGFSLTNTWELDNNGTLLDTVTYVLGIFSVHACTCSALTSAFFYRTLTNSDPEKAVAWVDEHPRMFHLPYMKFVVGTMAYLASVILVAWKELGDQNAAKIVTLVIGVMSCSTVVGTYFMICMSPPSKMKR